MAGIYQAAAAPGQAIGQGLMGIGRVATDIKDRSDRQKAQAEEKRLSQTLGVINMFTKMGEGLSPENRQRLFTAQLMPALAQAGGVPEGMDVEKMGQFVATLSALDQTALKGMHADNNDMLELLDKGDYKGARRLFSQMQSDYSRYPGAKDTLGHFGKLLDDESGEIRQDIRDEKSVGRAKQVKRDELELKKEFGLLDKQPKDTRTTAQKEFDRYKQSNPDYQGDFLDFISDRAKRSAAKKSKDNDYLTDKGKQIDDTRSYYAQKARAMENDLGAITDQSSYSKLIKDMQSDLARIVKGRRPKWMDEQEDNDPLGIR